MTFRVDIETEQRRALARDFVDGRDSIYAVEPDEVDDETTFSSIDRGEYAGCAECGREVGDFHKLGCGIAKGRIRATPVAHDQLTALNDSLKNIGAVGCRACANPVGEHHAPTCPVGRGHADAFWEDMNR